MIKRGLSDGWYELSIKKKLYVLMIGVTLFMAVAILLNIHVSFAFIGDVRQLMDDNLSSYKFMESFDTETEAFKNMIHDWTKENEKIFLAARKETMKSMDALSFDYRKIGEERYAITWNIRNSYEEYQKQRDKTIAMKGSGKGYISDLYKTYQMQDYLKTYASRLKKVVLDEGNNYYEIKDQLLTQMPYILTVISFLSFCIFFVLLRMMINSIIRIVLKLVVVTSEIENNNFSIPDVSWKGKDEIGLLVSSVNKMKHAMRNYLLTMEEKRVIEEQLHQKELEKANLEQRFSFAQLQLVKSQLNPHFLFNTLNMTTRMAQMEEAPITEEILVSLSNLLRYSLRTTEAFAPLNQELKIVKDYMYIQKKRFGDRVWCTVDCQIRADEVEVPVFLLQPLVENAVIHGITDKEKGGHIEIRIQKEGEILQITVADDGVGISEEKLQQIRNAGSQNGSALGIGLGNINKRLQAYYEQGEVRIDSKEGEGTTVTMVFGHRKV